MVLVGLGLGLVGVLGGLAWRSAAVDALDARLLQRVNLAAWPPQVDLALGVLRLAGTTGFFVIALGTVALANPGWALTLAAVALASEAVTWALKHVFRRPRPYAALPSVVVRLTRLPRDASFPSGDAMRGGFLGGIAVTAFGFPTWAAGLAMVLALGVGVGRVRSGAHYPLDVWAGALLGLGAALVWAGCTLR
jgi:membrane-associated phospholipid phosphatase